MSRFPILVAALLASSAPSPTPAGPRVIFQAGAELSTLVACERVSEGELRCVPLDAVLQAQRDAIEQQRQAEQIREQQHARWSEVSL